MLLASKLINKTEEICTWRSSCEVLPFAVDQKYQIIFCLKIYIYMFNKIIKLVNLRHSRKKVVDIFFLTQILVMEFNGNVTAKLSENLHKTVQIYRDRE